MKLKRIPLELIGPPIVNLPLDIMDQNGELPSLESSKLVLFAKEMDLPCSRHSLIVRARKLFILINWPIGAVSICRYDDPNNKQTTMPNGLPPLIGYVRWRITDRHCRQYSFNKTLSLFSISKGVIIVGDYRIGEWAKCWFCWFRPHKRLFTIQAVPITEHNWMIPNHRMLEQYQCDSGYCRNLSKPDGRSLVITVMALLQWWLLSITTPIVLSWINR